MAAPGQTAAEAAADPIVPIEETDVRPKLLKTVDPQYSKEARKKRISGTVQLQLVVDTHGMPTEIEVLSGVGYGLDENAVAVASQYRFKPAMKNGRAVRVQLKVSVSYHMM